MKRKKEGNASLNVLHEQVNIDKEIVVSGKVIIHKNVIEQNEMISLPVSHEEVKIKKVAVNKYVDTAPAIRYEGDTTIIPVIKEVLIVEKKLLLVIDGFDERNVDYARGAESDTYSNDENRNDNESGISRFFRNLFGDDDESDRYSRVAKTGYIVTVHAGSIEEARRASKLLDDYGAIDIDEKNYENMQSRNISETTDIDTTNDESGKIPVIEEDLQVGKRVVETGGVRLRSRIIERPVEETIRLREEHVTVQRNKVDRPASSEELDNLEEETIEVREHKEVPVVNKEATVVEEVSVDKTVDQREETIRDNVRRKDVKVEDLKGKSKTEGR